MTRTLILLSNLLGFGLTALAFALGRQVGLALVPVLIGGAWFVAYRQRWIGDGPLGLFLVFGFATAGFLMHITPVPLYLAAFLALAGWDLAGMGARLELASPEENLKPLRKRHYLRLGVTLAIGGLLVAAALAVHLRLSFEMIALLTIFAAWGIGRVIARLQKTG